MPTASQIARLIKTPTPSTTALRRPIIDRRARPVGSRALEPAQAGRVQARELGDTGRADTCRHAAGLPVTSDPVKMTRSSSSSSPGCTNNIQRRRSGLRERNKRRGGLTPAASAPAGRMRCTQSPITSDKDVRATYRPSSVCVIGISPSRSLFPPLFFRLYSPPS